MKCPWSGCWKRVPLRFTKSILTVVLASRPSWTSQDLALKPELQKVWWTFTVFPNPANDVIIVNVDGFVAHSMQVLDATGRVIMSERLVAGRNVIDVTSMANGTYKLVLDEGQSRQVKQLIIAH